MLIDPPREGAQAVAQALSLLAAEERPRRIVYVSCNPATLRAMPPSWCTRAATS